MERAQSDYPFFIAQGGSLNGQRWLISKVLLIGRDENCDIVVADRQVSRQHAKLTRKQEGVILEDLGSKNGTYLNNQRVNSPVLLHDGDLVQIAMAQEFTYLSSDATLPLDDLSTVIQPEQLLKVDLAAHRVWVRGNEVTPPLSRSQFDLLSLLVQKTGEVVSRDEAIQAVWGDITEGISEQALDALVRRLRERLFQADPTHEYIITMRGHGFRLENPFTS